jgi:hypothetical protein
MGGAIRKKLQVFISSTYEDMKDERQVAVQAVLEARHIPAGMELFAAGDESQLETIRRWIDESDVFLLLLGGRYGSIEPKSKKSYVEVEYDYALEQKKAYFAVVVSDAGIQEKTRKEGPKVLEQAHPDSLTAFRKKVLSKICASVGSPGDIRAEILKSLRGFEERDNLVGWVSGEILKQLPAPASEPSELAIVDGKYRSQPVQPRSVSENGPEADGAPAEPPAWGNARRVFGVFRKAFDDVSGGTVWYLEFKNINEAGLGLDRKSILRAVDLLKAAHLVKNSGTGAWELTDIGKRFCASGQPIDECLKP